MRLLRATTDDNFELSEHDEGKIPPFAILSHTWGPDDEEVTFADMLSGKGKEKAGYEKLLFCASRAKEDGVDYFWVDTCCIDKSSSAELSEAINCMFRWYAASAVCYVYLTDVMLENREQSLKASRWFTRGWTLQEMIAPKKVLFFESGGECLGDKTSLCQQLCDITGVPLTALQGSPLHKFSVGERLQWASGRSTRRAEDAAYCLLGLCSVNMPLIYGEGRQRAFTRLRRELRSTTQDPNLYGASLYHAVRGGHLATVELLLEDGVSVNYVLADEFNESVLHAAVRSGSAEIMKMLLATRPMLDPYSRQGITPLMLAAVQGNEAAVTMLLEAGGVFEFRLQPLRPQPDPEIDTDGRVMEGSLPLLLAAQNGHLETTRTLLKFGAHVDSRTVGDFTALIAAAINGHTKCVQLLLDHGAEVDAVAGDWTALIFCANRGHIDCAAALLDAGANIEAKSCAGMTPLLEAAWNDRIDFVKFIIERGANKAAQAEWADQYNGQTALHIAVDDDHLGLVEMCIKCGVPSELKKGDGETALEFAKRLGRKEMVERLETYSAAD